MSSFALRNILMCGTVAAIGLAAGQAQAAGFYIQEQSVSGLGSAFSGSTTNLHDASTIYFNPAGMTNLEGTNANLGVNVLVPNSKVKDNGSTAPLTMALGGASGNPYDPTPVPNGYLSYQINDWWWAGIGVSAPFGLGSDYGETWFGRFDSTKTELAIIDVQPTMAFQIAPWVSLGVGVNIQHSDADLRNHVNLVGLGLGEGTSKLTGDDWGVGYSIGMQFKPFEGTTVGLNYKSEVHHKLDGRIEVSTLAGAPVASQTSNGSAKLNTPDHATLGVAQKLNERWTVQGQVSWYGWNNFDHIAAYRDTGALASRVEQNYQTTRAYALGAEYIASDAWTLRGGMQYDATPTTDEYRSSRTPDGDRTWVSLGASYKFAPQWSMDMAATYIDVEDGVISVNRGAANPTTGAGAGTMRAKTEGDVGIIALGLNYKF
ncbi:MAG TPA: outer membrane protein transport protein [Micavibrio sp.]